MLQRILAFFEAPSQESESQLSVDDAAAVLLIEVMMADHDMDQRERQVIGEILVRRLSCTEAEAADCIESALAHHAQSHDTFQFTKLINEQWTEQQRFELLVDLWRVAFADGELDKYEDHRIRRIAEWLHLHHSHFIKAKAVAQASQ